MMRLVRRSLIAIGVFVLGLIVVSAFERGISAQADDLAGVRS
jgi:hypothetical protein